MTTSKEEQWHQQLLVLATDIAVLYDHFTERFPNPNSSASQSTVAELIRDFQELFDASKMEYLHYAGGTNAHRTPYHPSIVQDILQLCAAYLYIPRDAARPHVHYFGLLATYFMFTTQPAQSKASTLPPTKVRVGTYILQEMLRLHDTGPIEGPDAAIGQSAPPAPHTSSSGRGFSELELHVMTMMHKYRAWQMQPYVNVAPYLTAIMKAHDRSGSPLLQHGIASPIGASSPVASMMHSFVMPSSQSSAFGTQGGVMESSTLLEDASFQADLAQYTNMTQQLGL